MVNSLSTASSMLIRYPNNIGDSGRYTLTDQREYFSKFPGGSCRFFQLALENVLCGDLLEYVNQCTNLYDLYKEQCDGIFDTVYAPLVADNTFNEQDYLDESREYSRRIFDIYRYAKSSVAPVGIDRDINTVQLVLSNPRFDTGAFLIR